MNKQQLVIIKCERTGKYFQCIARNQIPIFSPIAAHAKLLYQHGDLYNQIISLLREKNKAFVIQNVTFN